MCVQSSSVECAFARLCMAHARVEYIQPWQSLTAGLLHRHSAWSSWHLFSGLEGLATSVVWPVTDSHAYWRVARNLVSKENPWTGRITYYSEYQASWPVTQVQWSEPFWPMLGLMVFFALAAPAGGVFTAVCRAYPLKYVLWPGH